MSAYDMFRRMGFGLAGGGPGRGRGPGTGAGGRGRGRGRGGRGGGGVSTPSFPFTLEDSGNFNWSGTTNLGTKTFGAESAGRVLVLTFGWARQGIAREVTAVSIGGVSATHVIRHVDGTALRNAEIWYVQLDSGTSGNVTITFDGTGGTDNGGQYTLYNLPGFTATPASSGDMNGGEETSVQSAGAIFVVGVERDRATAVSFSANGDAGLTEDAASIFSSGVSHSFAASSSQIGGGAYTFNASNPSSNDSSVLARWV